MEPRDPLAVLKSQRAFLEGGGYRYSPRTPWKAPLIFEDSPLCLNFEQPTRPHPCSRCALMRFVPLRRRSALVPCRHIPLNATGETLDGLYRYASREETEGTVVEWLRGAIQRLEATAGAGSPSGGSSLPPTRPPDEDAA